MTEQEIRDIESRIIQCKVALDETDYLVLKSYEGEDMSKYGDWKTLRHSLRNEINELEEMLKQQEQI